jgi:hypothetical protein
MRLHQIAPYGLLDAPDGEIRKRFADEVDLARSIPFMTASTSI